MIILWVRGEWNKPSRWLQIIKWDDNMCYSEMLTSWSSVFKQRFLPAPVSVRQESTDPDIPERGSVKKWPCVREVCLNAKYVEWGWFILITFPAIFEKISYFYILIFSI